MQLWDILILKCTHCLSETLTEYLTTLFAKYSNITLCANSKKIIFYLLTLVLIWFRGNLNRHLQLKAT